MLYVILLHHNISLYILIAHLLHHSIFIFCDTIYYVFHMLRIFCKSCVCNLWYGNDNWSLNFIMISICFHFHFMNQWSLTLHIFQVQKLAKYWNCIVFLVLFCMFYTDQLCTEQQNNVVGQWTDFSNKSGTSHKRC